MTDEYGADGIEVEGTGLARAIEALRAELGIAQDAGANQQLRFEIEEAQLELLLELRKDVKPGVKLAFGVVTAGVDGGVASTRTHRLTLKLKVRDEALGGRNAEVNRPQSRPWER
ncbi:trypco2 family protein [Streptomyces sp. NPDC058239]|uniref:trypco2 family protein n=1 Tax=Streptomyces sp. NPDC058239 TaxID=3346395 RepID=UPI0036E3E63F